MYNDKYGIVSRWHQAARRGTIANIGWAMGILALVAWAMTLTIG